MGALADIKSTVDEFKGLGQSIAAKNQNVSEYANAPKKASKTSAPVTPPAPAPAKDSGKRYGDNPGEKRYDVRDMIKPLGSFKEGTDYVPKTGPYVLHEGEKVVPKEENKMDAKTAMEKITGSKGKPPKKIKEIRTKVSDNGKLVHTHLHHHPEHHADEVHVSDDAAAASQHLTDQAPNMSAQPPEMPEAAPSVAPTM